MASGPFTLAQLAEAVGMSVDDVEFYRDRGLLQLPRRQRGRPNRLAFHAEHVERMKFIKRAPACGFMHEDIARFVDRDGLVTCGDIHDVTRRRLETLQAAGKAGTPQEICLGRLREVCTGVGGRKDCRILETLSRPNA